MATINMHMKFEIEIPKQTWLMLLKPCRLQTDGRTDGQGESSIPPLQLRWAGYNNRAPLLCYFKLCASFRSHLWFQTWVSPETPNLGQIWRFLEPCDLAIWRMTLKNNRAPLLFYFKLCASFRTHWWIQTGITLRKCPIWVKIDDFYSPVTLKLDGWPWKTIGHLFYATSSYMHHFIIICEFKLELQSGNG